MAPDMSDAPQVVPQSDYPETSWKYEQSVPEYHDKSAPSYSHVPVPYTEYETKDHSRILGLRRRIFWVLLVVAIVVVSGGIVGASVGGTLAVKNSANKSESNASASPSPISSSIPSASPSNSAAANNSSPTPSASSASASSTPPTVGYAPLNFAQVSTIKIDCPTPNVYVPGSERGAKSRYNCEPRRSVGLGGVDVAAFTAYTFQQCVDACSQWNELSTKSQPCKAVVIAADLGNRRTIGNGANCWLKSSSDSDDKDMPLMTSFTLIQ